MMDKNETPEQSQLEDIYLINNIDTLKVIADEKRLQILEYLILQAATVKQLASEMGIVPTKLYYHIKQLEDHNLIKVVETQIVSGIIEKTYRARARRFSMDRDLLPTADVSHVEAALDVALSILDHTKNNLKQLIHLGRENAEMVRGLPDGDVSRYRLYLTAEQAKKFASLLKEVVDSQRHEPSGKEGELPFYLVTAFYPFVKIDGKQDED